MRCEVVAVGTELLLGQIVDTNSAWIGEHLALIGVDSHFQTKVGDNQFRIVLAIRSALARSDAVVVCKEMAEYADLGQKLAPHQHLVDLVGAPALVRAAGENYHGLYW